MDLDPEQFRQIATIFAKACQLDEAARQAFLNEACREDDGLRVQVQRLIEDDVDPAFSLDVPPLARMIRAEGAAFFDDAGRPPANLRRVGRYEIVGVLGEGGMGIVYEARQEHPARSVALKVLKPGMLSRSSQRRLQQEAEILGKLQHPGIASVYEAGLAEGAETGGRSVRQPFFAMELIRGRPLDVYVAEERLSSRERLALLADICDAVHHAHQKGIIHRDLKPGNIMVDAAGSPKILDFGVARITDADIRTTTLQTDVGQLIGTIAYMSPEQVSGNALELDTRSDVYALGVIGYELLAGSPPQDLSRVPVPEAVRLIRDGSVTPLSSVNKVFRGDLDIIFAKALEKERERRYSAAAELADDIRRHLHDQPIAARPASTLYQARKFARRHKALTASLALLFVVTASFGAWMGLLYRRADRQAERARLTQRFLEKMLSSIEPEVALGQDTTLIRGVLSEAAEQVGVQMARQPTVEADIRTTIGATYLRVGHAELAEPQLEAALDIRRRELGDHHDSVAATLLLLAECAGKLGHRDRAEELARRAVDLRRAQSDTGNLKVAEALETLGWIRSELFGNHQDAALLYEESLEITQRLGGREHPLYAEGLHRLAIALWRWSRLDEAETVARETLALKRRMYGADHPSVARAMDLVGQILATAKKYDEAEPLIRQAFDLHARLYGEEHPVYATALNSLADLLCAQGDYEGAEPLARRCLELVTKLRGEESHETAFAWMNLANLLDKKGDYAEAERHYREADKRFRNVFPPDHPYVCSPLMRLAEMLDRIGKHVSAETLWRQLTEETRERYPPGHENFWRAANKAMGLGRCLSAQHRCAEAEPLLAGVYEGLRAGDGEDDTRTMQAAENLIDLYESCGFPDKAAALRRSTERMPVHAGASVQSP